MQSQGLNASNLGFELRNSAISSSIDQGLPSDLDVSGKEQFTPKIDKQCSIDKLRDVFGPPFSEQDFIGLSPFRPETKIKITLTAPCHMMRKFYSSKSSHRFQVWQ